jgi:hypothetical protein
VDENARLALIDFQEKNMGISGQQFWATSKNGKAMLIFLAQRGVRGGAGDVELVRDTCEWLVDQREKGLREEAQKRGANQEQAKIVARDGVAKLRAIVERINDRNVASHASDVVDAVFIDHMRAGNAAWTTVMAWFADKLREKVKDDPADLVRG